MTARLQGETAAQMWTRVKDEALLRLGLEEGNATQRVRDLIEEFDQRMLAATHDADRLVLTAMFETKANRMLRRI